MGRLTNLLVATSKAEMELVLAPKCDHVSLRLVEAVGSGSGLADFSFHFRRFRFLLDLFSSSLASAMLIRESP